VDVNADEAEQAARAAWEAAQAERGRAKVEAATKAAEEEAARTVITRDGHVMVTLGHVMTKAAEEAARTVAT